MNVGTSLEFLIQVSQLFGLVSFDVTQFNSSRTLCESQKRIAHAKTVLAVFCLIQGWFLVKTDVESAYETGMLMITIIRVLHNLSFSAAVVSMYLIVITRGKHICKALNFLDRFSSLLPKKRNYQRALSKNPKLFLSLLVYFPTVFCSIIYIFYYGKTQWSRIFRSSFFAAGTWQENLFSGQFLMIANSFRAVLIGYNESLACFPSNNGRRVVNYLQKMKKNDLLLKDAFQTINYAYKWNFLFSTFWFFMALVYFINRSTLQVNFVFWAIYIGFRMSSTLSICHDLYKEVEKTAHHLHELFIEIDDPLLREEIEIFSLQLMHRKVEFNACGFFKLDFSLLHSMIATVSTYIIILMQLQKDSNNMGCHKYNCSANCTAAAT